LDVESEDGEEVEEKEVGEVKGFASLKVNVGGENRQAAEFEG
jgi:hypothetical protein